MHDWPSWWTIGIAVGFGVGLGIFFAGLTGGKRALLPLAIVAASGVAAAIGFLVWHWAQALGGVAGGLVGTVAAGGIVLGAMRRGGTRGGLAVLVSAAAVVVAALALVPVIGYLEAVGLPALAARLRRRAPERYAGLRTLARD